MSLRMQFSAVSADRWDDFVASTAGGSHKQTSSWARVKRLQGWRSRRVVVCEDQGARLVGGAQILLKPLPILPIAGQIGYVVKGPLVAGPDPAAQSRVLKAIHQLCRTERIGIIIVQPSEDAPPVEPLLQNFGYVPSPLSLAPTATVVVDLDADLDVLWRRLGKHLRKNIRRAEAKGVMVRRGTRADLDVFYRLLKSASQRLSYKIFPHAYYARILDEFAPKGQAQLFVAELGGQPVSVQLCVTYRGTMHSMALAWSGEHHGAHVNDVLDWKTISWAHTQGIARYDLESISDELARRLLAGDEPSQIPMKGSDAYKLKWSRKVVTFPRPYLRATNPMLRGLVSMVPDDLMTATLSEARNRFRMADMTDAS